MTIIFSDEKKLNLNSPDGIQCYWHDLGKKEQIFSKRPFDGGFIMIWRAFSANGKSELVVIEGRQNAQKHVEVLYTSLLPFSEVHHGQDFIFQQDNASIDTVKVTKAWFEVKNTVLDWPAKLPDLNPIENLWGIFSTKVYIQRR